MLSPQWFVMHGDSILLTYLSAFLIISVHRFLARDSLGWKVQMLNIYCQLVLQKVEPLLAIQECKSTHLGLQKRYRAKSDSTVVWCLDIQWLGTRLVSTWSRTSLAEHPAGTEGSLYTGRGLITQLALGCLARREFPPGICLEQYDVHRWCLSILLLRRAPSPLRLQVCHHKPRF